METATAIVAIATLVLTILACVAQWMVVPEFRRRFGLPDPPEAVARGVKKLGTFTRTFLGSKPAADAGDPVPQPFVDAGGAAVAAATAPSRPAAAWVLRLADDVRTHGLPQELRRKLERRARDRTLKAFSFTGDGRGWLMLYGHNGFSGDRLPSELREELEHANRTRTEIADVAFGPDGAWLLLLGDGTLVSRHLPAVLAGKLEGYRRSGSPVRQVALGPDGGWVVLRGANGFSHEAIPPALDGRLIECNRSRQEIRRVELLADGGWLLLHGRDGVAAEGLPEVAGVAVAHCRKSGAELRAASFGGGALGD